jgi:hypothetical protein
MFLGQLQCHCARAGTQKYFFIILIFFTTSPLRAPSITRTSFEATLKNGKIHLLPQNPLSAFSIANCQGDQMRL